MGDALTVHRLELCTRVRALFERERVLLWRAPYGVGKTSTAELLQLEFGWCRCALTSDLSLEQVPVFQASGMLDLVSLKDVLELNVVVPSNVIVIDEAQLAFPFTADHWFWRAIKSIANLPVKLRVLMLSSYGTPSEALAYTTPVELPRRLGYEDLLFTEAEAMAMYDAYRSGVGQGFRVLTKPEWLLIQELTGRHPFLLRTAISMILD